MSTELDFEDVLDLVAMRIDVLELLDGERVPKRRIVDELDYSRSTVNRAVTALSEAGLVDDAPSGCQTTFVGSLLAEQYSEYVQTVRRLVANREILNPLSRDVDLPPDVLADAEVSLSEGSSPYEPYHALEAVLDSAVGTVRVYVPTFSNPRGLELARTLATDHDVEIVFGDRLLEELRADVPDEVGALFELEGFTGFETATGPDYSLVLVETESGTDGALVVHSPERELVGCIVTSNRDTIRWMEQQYSEIRAESERVESIS
jgi:predicted transcriptional regulator